MDTCNDAKDKYRESDYLGYTIGTIKVTTSDKFGICGKVSNVSLNDRGNYLEVGTDKPFIVALDYQIWSWVDENRKQQIIVGLDDEPFWCVYDGISMAYSSLSGHERTLTEIQEPGTYTLMWMTTFCDNAKDGMDFYKSHPELREKIGMIKVTDCRGGICDNHCEVISILLNGQDGYLEIGPGETIRITIYYEIWSMRTCPECIHRLVIGLEDNPMYCAYNGTPGIYPGIFDHDQVFYEMTAPTEPGTYNIMCMHVMGYTCDVAKNLYRGLPESRKKIGTIKVTKPDDLGICCKISNVSLNKQGDYLEVWNDEAFLISFNYQIWRWGEDNNRRQIMVGLDDEPFWCVYDGIPLEYPGLSRYGLNMIEIQKPGTYDLMWMITFCDNPKDGGDFYRSHPDLRKKIGTIKVTAYGNGGWELKHEKSVDYDGTISFYQQGNYLQVRISTTPSTNWAIGSGSVSISVNESINVSYDTTSVSGLYRIGENYKEIKSEMTLTDRTALLVAGLLGGYLGAALGIVGYAQDTTDFDEPNWYDEEEDLVNDIMPLPSTHFEQYDTLNWRDNIIIPWYISRLEPNAKSIKVNCPEMQFPKAGIYNMVFRVDYTTSMFKVRYDVALPITVV
jgi:uncharacterized Zn-finger protein